MTPCRPTRSTSGTCKRRSPRSTSSGDELARAGDALHVPVLGSGHPLADVFLLKWSPQPSEIQEGVAFFGRAGQALLKSLQRLGVDPLAVYGTNCLKFGDRGARAGRGLARRASCTSCSRSSSS